MAAMIKHKDSPRFCNKAMGFTPPRCVSYCWVVLPTYPPGLTIRTRTTHGRHDREPQLADLVSWWSLLIFFSIDWFKEKVTGKSHISWENHGKSMVSCRFSLQLIHWFLGLWLRITCILIRDRTSRYFYVYAFTDDWWSINESYKNMIHVLICMSFRILSSLIFIYIYIR